jgi:uncharacterized membrane protein
MATLMAVCYPDTSTASLALHEVERRSAELGVAGDAAAVIIRDGSGNLTAITNARAIASGSGYAMFWGPLFGYLFFVPMLGMSFGTGLTPLMGKIERMAITEHFERRIRELLRPSTSALFLVLEGGPDRVVGALSEFSGTVLSNPLSPEGHRRLQEALYGRAALTG